MSKFADAVETAFDLNFLNFPKCPPTEIKTIGILGGGTAGYLAALALKRYHPQIKVQIIESSKIPVIGVGESTTTEIVPFLHRGLGIDPIEFSREVEPTWKFGIKFDWGQPDDPHFNFSFFAGHQHESFYYENSTANSNWISNLMNANRIPLVRDEDDDMTSFLGSVAFSYHLDNKKLIRFLRKTLAQRKIEILDKDIEIVNLDTDGKVSSLETKDNEKFSFDLYIDCSGFRSKILGQALKTEFIPFTSTLFTDRALTFDMPLQGEIDCYTSVITMDNGWCWKIPMRNEDHYGYVFSSHFCDEQTALKEAREKFGHFENYKMVEFKSGRYKTAWNKNVFSFGNASGFIEPLESTAIQTAIHSITLLCRLMPTSMQDTTSIAAINHEVAATWDTFRWFLGVHYKFNNKLDTPFWQHCRKNTNIGNAELIVDLFKKRPPLSAGNFGTGSAYTAYEPLVFNSYSYDSILFGQKIVDKDTLKAPAMSKEEYFSRVEAYKYLTEKAVSLKELFGAPREVEEDLLAQLYSDPDTWILEADV